MTSDDLDSVVDHGLEEDEDREGKHSKRDRLKDAMNRTKSKINKVQEDRKAKKHQLQPEKSDYKLNEDVDDFLAAGRTSRASSQRPSIASVNSSSRPSIEATFPPHYDVPASPRPSTSDSKSQQSPRRGPPISIPRIDVSSTSRFPNAKQVDPDSFVTHVNPSPISTSYPQSTSLLKPEYKSRSQSTSSIASAARKARIRGLSVGFIDAPPVIIGEGGDEAQAPPVEISKAKEHASSASLHGRQPYIGPESQHGARKPVPTRGSNEAPNIFTRKPLARTQTGMSLDNLGSEPIQSHLVNDNDFVPKSFARSQTGFSGEDSPHPVRRAPTIPVLQKENEFVPKNLPSLSTGGFDLTKEFEMTLGLTPSTHSSPALQKAPGGLETPIFAPKPKRAPPSYDLIEGNRKVGDQRPEPVSLPQEASYQLQQQVQLHQVSPPAQPNQQYSPITSERRSLSDSRTQLQGQMSQQISPQQYSQQQRRVFLQRSPQQDAPFQSGQQQPPLPQKISQQTDLSLTAQRNPSMLHGSPQQAVQPQTQQQTPVPPQSLAWDDSSLSQQQNSLPPQKPSQYSVRTQSRQQASSSPNRLSQEIVQPSLRQHSPLTNQKPLVQESQSQQRFDQQLQAPFDSIQGNNAPLSEQGYFPPPPQRTLTQTARIPQRLERISPRPNSRQQDEHLQQKPGSQETGVTRNNSAALYSKAPLQLITSNEDNGYGLLTNQSRTRPVDNHHSDPSPAVSSSLLNSVRRIGCDDYTESSNHYDKSVTNTPHTATVPTPTKQRFYESINQGGRPEGYI